MSLDLDAIRGRVQRAGPFSIARWIATDLHALLAEVDRLRAGEPPVDYDRELRKVQSRAWVLERDLAAARAEVDRQRKAHAAEVAKLRAALDAERLEVEAERTAFVHYLRSFAEEAAPGPASPVRKAAQAFAARAASVVERGEHRTAPEREAS